jgi:hypothetical protein
MCLPCFPWTWTEYEDPLDSMPEQHVWVHDGQAWSLQRCVSVESFYLHQLHFVLSSSFVIDHFAILLSFLV